jgi:hypothetical protein
VSKREEPPDAYQKRSPETTTRMVLGAGRKSTLESAPVSNTLTAESAQGTKRIARAEFGSLPLKGRPSSTSPLLLRAKTLPRWSKTGPPDSGKRSPGAALGGAAAGADRKGTLAGADSPESTPSPCAAQAAGHVVLAVYSGTELIGSIVEIGGRSSAWTPKDVPIGSYSNRREAFRAVSEYAPKR